MSPRLARLIVALANLACFWQSLISAWDFGTPLPPLGSKLCRAYVNRTRSLSFVCDPDDVLNPDDIDEINGILRRLYGSSRCLYCARNATRCGSNINSSSTGDYNSMVVAAGVVNTPVYHKQEMSAEQWQSVVDSQRTSWKLSRNSPCQIDVLIFICKTCSNTVLVSQSPAADAHYPQEATEGALRKAEEFLERGFVRSAMLQALSIYLPSQALGINITNSDVVENGKNSLSPADYSEQQRRLIRTSQSGAAGLHTVVVLCVLFSISWMACVTYLLVQVIIRRKFCRTSAGSSGSRSHSSSQTEGENGNSKSNHKNVRESAEVSYQNYNADFPTTSKAAAMLDGGLNNNNQRGRPVGHNLRGTPKNVTHPVDDTSWRLTDDEITSDSSIGGLPWKTKLRSSFRKDSTSDGHKYLTRKPATALLESPSGFDPTESIDIPGVEQNFRGNRRPSSTLLKSPSRFDPTDSIGVPADASFRADERAGLANQTPLSSSLASPEGQLSIASDAKERLSKICEQCLNCLKEKVGLSLSHGRPSI